MGIKTVPHRPYCPDLAPCDFWLFPKLRGCRYETIEEMKESGNLFNDPRIYIYVYTYTYIDICIHTFYVNTHIYIYIHTLVYIHIHLYIEIYIHIHTRM